MKYYHLDIGWQEDHYGLKEWPDIVEREGRTEVRGVLVNGLSLLVTIPHSQRWAIVEQPDLVEPITTRGSKGG